MSGEQTYSIEAAIWIATVVPCGLVAMIAYFFHALRAAEHPAMPRHDAMGTGPALVRPRDGTNEERAEAAAGERAAA